MSFENFQNIFSNPTINSNVKILVRGNGEPVKIYTAVMTRGGKIHKTEWDVLAERGSVNVTLEIEATPDMYPSANLIVWYIQSAGEIIYDQITLKITNQESNQVKRSS